MSPPNRRQFLQNAAGAFAAILAHPFAARSADTNNAAAWSQASHPLDIGAIRSLAGKIDGHLVTPESPDYESARLVFNRAFDRRPALIIYCASVSDVARGLEFAQTRNTSIAVRGGGHNRAGFSSCDAGVVIDLSAMNRVKVDIAERVAHADGGALTINLDAAAQGAGLATTSAGCPTVGLAASRSGAGKVC